jgi:hypothetical protein
MTSDSAIDHATAAPLARELIGKARMKNLELGFDAAVEEELSVLTDRGVCVLLCIGKNLHHAGVVGIWAEGHYGYHAEVRVGVAGKGNQCRDGRRADMREYGDRTQGCGELAGTAKCAELRESGSRVRTEDLEYFGGVVGECVFSFEVRSHPLGAQWFWEFAFELKQRVLLQVVSNAPCKQTKIICSENLQGAFGFLTGRPSEPVVNREPFVAGLGGSERCKEHDGDQDGDGKNSKESQAPPGPHEWRVALPVRSGESGIDELRMASGDVMRDAYEGDLAAKGHRRRNRSLGRCIRDRFRCDFQQGVGGWITESRRGVCQVLDDSRDCGCGLGPEFGQGKRGFRTEYKVRGAKKRSEGWDDNIRFKLEFTKGINGGVDYGNVGVGETCDQCRNGRLSVGAELRDREGNNISDGRLFIDEYREKWREASGPDLREGPRGSCVSRDIVGFVQNVGEGWQCFGAEVWEYKGSSIGHANVGVVQDLRESRDGGCCGGAECHERAGCSLSPQKPRVLKEPVPESCRQRKAIHESSELGGSPKLCHSTLFLVLDPLQEQGQPVGSNVQDSFLRILASSWCSCGIITNEPIAQWAVLVKWLFVSGRKKEACDCDKQRHGSEESDPASQWHARIMA